MATTDKYDRQLRLWGASGQRALGETCVVLIRATAAGTETVKNLVLPGIGSIFVLDDVAAVTTEYASNFFLVKADNDNKTRAQMATEHLQELNPDVKGGWMHAPDGLLSLDLAQTVRSSAAAACSSSSQHPISKRSFLVVASDLEPPLLDQVAATCHDNRWPLVAVHSYGLVGVVRLQTPPMPLLQPKLRDTPPDLRLVRPFPRLQSLLQQAFPTQDWSCLENHQHAHIPYPLILLKLAHEWKQSHGGGMPSTFAEKQEFQASIKKAARNWDNELNFQEAVKNAYLAYAERELDLDHLAQLRDAAALSCPNLHALLQALDQFLLQHSNQAPLQGTIPDMTASTELYVQLQQAYKEQADEDWRKMRALVPVAVSDEEVSAFCQNVFSLDLMQTRTLHQEHQHETTIPDDIVQELVLATMEGDERPDQVPLLWYLGFRACQIFYRQMGRYPGAVVAEDQGDTSSGGEDKYKQDVAPLHAILIDVVKHYGLHETELLQSTILKGGGNQDFATEMTRYGNAEIHNIASIVGGVASQEAVKLITGQYVPLNNTYVYNGIASTGAVYQF